MKEIEGRSFYSCRLFLFETTGIDTKAKASKDCLEPRGNSLRADEIKLWLTPNQSLVTVCTQAKGEKIGKFLKNL